MLTQTPHLLTDQSAAPVRRLTCAFTPDGRFGVNAGQHPVSSSVRRLTCMLTENKIIGVLGGRNGRNPRMRALGGGFNSA